MDPTNLRTPLLRTLHERGFIRQATDLAGLDEAFQTAHVPMYIGFDLTAPSLHVGSMIQLMVLRHAKRAAYAAGLRPGEAERTINVVLGDATTRVGDPSDKDGARPILSRERIQENQWGIIACLDRIVGPRLDHYNSEWLDRLSFMDFLTGPAREMSLNRMVSADVVSRRLDGGLPMTLMELIYQSMQGMDFAHLHRRHDVGLQVGGSDQWTNILAGVDLGRRLHGGDLFGITTPLMTDESGRKMGKTADGRTVWLDPSLVSSFDLWQFWRNVPDGKVEEFLGLFTHVPMDEIRSLCAEGGAALNEAKTRLATEAVSIAHGEGTGEEAARSARTVFSGAAADASAPVVAPPFDPRSTTFTIAEAMVHAGLCPSKAAARRLAEQGGLRIDGEVERDADRDVPAAASFLLSAGRKRHVRMLAEGTAPTLPGSTRVQVNADGTHDVVGIWERDGIGPVEDVIASEETFDSAERRRLRVRTAK